MSESGCERRKIRCTDRGQWCRQKRIRQSKYRVDESYYSGLQELKKKSLHNTHGCVSHKNVSWLRPCLAVCTLNTVGEVKPGSWSVNCDGCLQGTVWMIILLFAFISIFSLFRSQPLSLNMSWMCDSSRKMTFGVVYWTTSGPVSHSHHLMMVCKTKTMSYFHSDNLDDKPNGVQVSDCQSGLTYRVTTKLIALLLFLFLLLLP